MKIKIPGNLILGVVIVIVPIVVVVCITKSNINNDLKIIFTILCFLIHSLLLWRLHRYEIKIKNKSVCWIPTCSKKPHTYGICVDHYNFYIEKDNEAKKLVDFLFRMYNNKLTLGEELLSFTSMFLHLSIPVQFKGHEHYPLENLFFYLFRKALKLHKQHKLRDAIRILSQLLIDFKHPENHALFNVEAEINEINANISGDIKLDPKFEGYISRLANLTLRPYVLYFIGGLTIITVIFYLSSTTNAAGFIDSQFYLKPLFPLLLIYGFLVPIFFGLNAVKAIPDIYNTIKEGHFYENQRTGAIVLGTFLDMIRMLKIKRGFDIIYRLKFIFLTIIVVVNVVKDVSAGGFASASYKLAELFLLGIVFYVYDKLRLFWKTLGPGVNLATEDITIDITHPDCVGGLKSYGNLLSATILIGTFMYLQILVVLPYVFINNHAFLPTLVFFTIALVPVMFLFRITPPWLKTFRQLFQLHKKMCGVKGQGLERITHLETKANITPDDVRELVVLKEALKKFQTYPVTVNERWFTVVKFLLISLGGYVVVKAFEYCLQLVGKIFMA